MTLDLKVNPRQSDDEEKREVDGRAGLQRARTHGKPQAPPIMATI